MWGEFVAKEEEIDKILKYGRELGYPLILDESVKFFIESVSNVQPKKVLEIGTAIGYSGSLILSNCEGELITLEKNENSAKIAVENFKKLGFNDRVKVVNCDAGEFIESCKDKFDFIFLDGPKAQYLHYKERLIGLLNIGGVLFADNVLFRGLVCKEGEPERKYRTIVNNLRQFLKEIENDDRLETKIYNIGDGISISKKIK